MKGIWDWLEDARLVGRLKLGAVGLLALLVAVDPFVKKSGYFAVEQVPSVSAILGLAGVLAIVVGGLLWGLVFRRRRYDDE